MLTFACAGLDSMVKQLIRDALPTVIERNEAANESFKRFIAGRLRRGDEFDHKLMAEVLCDIEPINRLVDTLISELVSGSLQSTSAVFRAGSFFDIPSRELQEDVQSLNEVFLTRNQIIHEMDVDFAQLNRNRRPRRLQSMIDGTNLIFSVANAFLMRVEAKLV